MNRDRSSGTRPVRLLVRSALVIAAALAVGVTSSAPGAHATTSMSFGFATQLQESNFTPQQVANVANDIDHGAILRWEVDWSVAQQHCMTALGNAQNDTQCQQLGGQVDPISWAYLDQELSPISTQLAAGDVKLVLYPMVAPIWAQGAADQNHQPNAILPPADDAWAEGYWQNFVTALVRHVEATYPGSLAGIEVWDEENGNLFWNTNAGPDPARYTALLCEAYNGVRSVDTNMPVIFGGMNEESAAAQPSSDWLIKDYLGQAYADGTNGKGLDIRNCMTSIGVHPYSTIDPSIETNPNGLHTFLQAMQDTAAATVAGNDPGRPISITEFGYDVPNVTQAQQASYLQEAYNEAPTSVSNPVNMFIVYSLFDEDNQNMGVCASPGNPRTAASTLKQMFSGNQSAQESC